MSSGRVEQQNAGEPATAGSAAEAAGGAASAGTGRTARPILVHYGVLALVTLAVVSLLALLGYGMLRRQGGSFAGFAVNAVGQAAELRVRPAPEFRLQLFDGASFNLSEQRGRVVVVNYWASWCPPCREEAPALEAAWRRYRGQGVVLVGVNVWDSERDARAFLREFGVTYPNGPDPSGGILIEYGVTGIPETYVIDRQGMLVRRWIGPLSEHQIGRWIEELSR